MICFYIMLVIYSVLRRNTGVFILIIYIPNRFIYFALLYSNYYEMNYNYFNEPFVVSS